MFQNNKIQEAIYGGIDDYNSTVPEEDRIAKEPDSILFDNSGKLDSVGYIALSVAIETRVQSEFGMTITLFANYPDYTGNKPLKSVSSLANYVAWLISKAQGGVKTYE